MKKHFVMLLNDFKNCEIEKNEKVKNAVKRDMREDVFDFIDFEITFFHDIEFLNVAEIEACDVIDVINEMTCEINTKHMIKT